VVRRTLKPQRIPPWPSKGIYHHSPITIPSSPIVMRFSTNTIRTILLILTSALLNSSLQANAYWTRVSLRIEGSKRTIFEGTVYTTKHIVTTKSGGTHECDGTNNGAHNTPGATIIGAIDDAVSLWDGNYDKETRDYSITSIGEDPTTNGGSWGLLVGYRFVRKGGCQTQVAADDRVLVAFGADKASAFLEATSDKTSVRLGEEVGFTVVNGKNGKPVESATMTAGDTYPKATTDAYGRAAISIMNAGVYRYKAEKDKAIRSNEVSIMVKAAAGAGVERDNTGGHGGLGQ